MFSNFMEDSEASDMFITGVAGTGKTTSLAEHVQYCIEHEIPYVVCAFTHKACGILRSKLPKGARVKTLHSYLAKRPTVNSNATKAEHIQSSKKVGATDQDVKVLFLDEYSMVGEKDFTDIVDAQDELQLKVIWIGDDHQLPPVGDTPAVVPYGKYQVVLTKQWRNDNPLQGPLSKLVSYIDGAKPARLSSVDGFFDRGRDIISEYLDDDMDDHVILAYTNQRVQELNQLVADRHWLEAGDRVFSPSTQHHYEFVRWVDYPTYIDIHFSKDVLQLGSKYKTLEHLMDAQLCKFMEVQDDDGEVKVWAVVFGHYDYKLAKEQLEIEAADSNKKIQDNSDGVSAAQWAKANPKTKTSKDRARAWRNYLSFKDCVICVDFPFAMTVHKSQGSTYEHVFIDTDDIAICGARDMKTYLKLLYVAISRASKRVITS